MSQTVESIEEQYSYLFAVRVALQDSYESESDIIRELKNYLLDIGKNPHNINQTLHGFYQHYGIDIQLHTIEQVPIVNNQILNNMLGFMLNSGDFDNSDGHGHIHIESEDEEEESYVVSNENEENPPASSSEPFFTIQLSSNGQSYTFNSQSNSNLGNIFSPAFSLPNPIPIHVSNPNEITGSLGPSSHINSHTHMVNLLNSLFNGLSSGGPIANSFQDVIVTVDDNDLEKLKSVKLESKLDTDCSICMGQMDKDEMVTELKCTHTFHTNCIEPYLKQYNYKCPVCRTEVGKAKYNM
jgi:hypothetical protein